MIEVDKGELHYHTTITSLFVFGLWYYKSPQSSLIWENIEKYIRFLCKDLKNVRELLDQYLAMRASTPEKH